MDWKFWTWGKWKDRARAAEEWVGQLNRDRVNLVQQMTQEFKAKMDAKEKEFEAQIEKLQESSATWGKIATERAAAVMHEQEEHKRTTAKLEEMAAAHDKLLAAALVAVPAEPTPPGIKLWLAKRATTEEEAIKARAEVEAAMGSLTEAHPVWKAIEAVLVAQWWTNHMAAVSGATQEERDKWLMRSSAVEDCLRHFEQLLQRRRKEREEK